MNWKSEKDKTKYNVIINTLSEIIKGLDIDLNNINLVVKLTNEIKEFDILNEKLLLLTRCSEYLSLIQGHSLELQKNYKTPHLYGLYERISELNRSVRMESDVLRSIISTQKSLITMKQ